MSILICHFSSWQTKSTGVVEIPSTSMIRESDLVLQPLEITISSMGNDQSHSLRHGGLAAGQFGTTPEELARSNFHKGNQRFKESDYRGAILQYRRAIDKLKMTDHERHYLHSTALSNVGCLEFAEGRHEDAMALLKEALTMLRSSDAEGPTEQNNTEETKEEIQRNILVENQNLKSLMMKIKRSPFTVNSHHFYFLDDVCKVSNVVATFRPQNAFHNCTCVLKE